MRVEELLHAAMVAEMYATLEVYTSDPRDVSPSGDLAEPGLEERHD